MKQPGGWSRFVTRALVLIVSGISVVPGNAFSADTFDVPKRPFRVEDSIGMKKLALSYTDTFVFSPNREWFVMITKQGNLGRKTNDYQLLLYKTTGVLEYLRSSQHDTPPEPVVLAQLSSSSNRPAITNPKWSFDSASLTFMGEAPGQFSQVYRVMIASKRVTRLTMAERGVFNYGASANSVVYSTTVEDKLTVPRTESFLVTQESLPTLFGVSTINPDEYGLYETYVQHAGRVPRRVSEEAFRSLPGELKYSVSPDGRYAVALRVPDRIPKSWALYGNSPLGTPLAATDDKNAVPGFIFQYVLIDLTKGSVAPLIDAPSATLLNDFGTRVAFWTPNSRSVLVTSALLPPNGPNAPKLQQDLRTSIIAEVDIASRKITIAGRLPPVREGTRLREERVYSWDAQARSLVVWRYNREDALPTFIIRKQGDSWQQTESPGQNDSTLLRASDGRDLQIEIVESLNSPPTVYARDLKSDQRKILLELNPEFRNLNFAESSIFEWTDRNGTSWRGGLLLPTVRSADQKLPLVIQTHGFSTARFLVDGAGGGGAVFGAQALANSGFVVLQVEDREEFVGRDEPAHYLDAYEAAIDLLSQRGVIDSNQVGLVGFSRTCWHVKYALTHSKYTFGAAVVSDGVDYGYFPFIASYNVLPGFDPIAGYLQVYKKLPVGEGLNAWQTAPAFNTDKVKTPLRIEAIGKFGFLFEWEWYVLLKRLRKPVELTIFPAGVHVLARPQDRFASQQGTIDWMKFWLKNEEDHDASKTEQYARWRKLRDSQQTDRVAR
jgi:dienelactone hydrolase